MPRPGSAAFFQVSLLSFFAYAVPVLMLFPLAWELVVDFRFATGCWEGYHFWIRGAVHLVHPVRDLPALRGERSHHIANVPGKPS